MSDYELALTAGEIDIALQKANSPDTSPQATSNLVTSGGVKTYVDNAIAAITAVTTPNIVQSVKTDKQTIQGATSLVWVDITDLEVNITPNFSNSKLLIRADVCFASTDFQTLFKILVDGSEVGVGTSSGTSYTSCSFVGGKDGHSGMSYIYSGNLSAGQATTIKIQGAKSGSKDIFVNYWGSTSQVMVTEIYQ